jgi:hypothetical protein
MDMPLIKKDSLHVTHEHVEVRDLPVLKLGHLGGKNFFFGKPLVQLQNQLKQWIVPNYHIHSKKRLY